MCSRTIPNQFRRVVLTSVAQTRVDECPIMRGASGNAIVQVPLLGCRAQLLYARPAASVIGNIIRPTPLQRIRLHKSRRAIRPSASHAARCSVPWFLLQCCSRKIKPDASGRFIYASLVSVHIETCRLRPLPLAYAAMQVSRRTRAAHT